MALQLCRRGWLGSLFSTAGIPLATGNSGCEVLIFLQDDSGNLDESSEPKGVLQNEECRREGLLKCDVVKFQNKDYSV